jgi:hypothetical protein
MIRNLLVLTLPSLVVLFFFAEMTVTYLIPAAQFPAYYYDPEDQILRFSTNDERDGVFTIGTMAQQRARWRINNMGWNSAIDFVPVKHTPRIVIIGDSYVEALQVNVEDSIAGQLRRMVSPQIEVYSFGISGASLSQYVQIARYARSHFEPDLVVINVVHNDFDESLCSVKRQAGMLCLDDDGPDIREAPIVPYQSNKAFRLVRRSSVIRFFIANLKVTERMHELFAPKAPHERYNANVDTERVASQRRRISKVTDYVLSTLKREMGGIPVMFLIDAPRRDIYAGTLRESSVAWLNEHLKNQCEKFQFRFIDLTNEFSRIFEVTRIPFESEFDWHWNERGHLAAAFEVYRKLGMFGLMGISPD